LESSCPRTGADRDGTVRTAMTVDILAEAAGVADHDATAILGVAVFVYVLSRAPVS
jgi:hypothetical protein